MSSDRRTRASPAAKPARRAVVRHNALRPAGHGDGQNLALARVDGPEDRRPLGAHRSAIRGVLDVRAAVDLAGRGEHRRADMEVRVRRVRLLRHRERRLDQRTNLVHLLHLNTPAVRILDRAVLNALDLVVELLENGMNHILVGNLDDLLAAGDLPDGRNHDSRAERGDRVELLDLRERNRTALDGDAEVFRTLLEGHVSDGRKNRAAVRRHVLAVLRDAHEVRDRELLAVLVRLRVEIELDRPAVMLRLLVREDARSVVAADLDVTLAVRRRTVPVVEDHRTDGLDAALETLKNRIADCVLTEVLITDSTLTHTPLLTYDEVLVSGYSFHERTLIQPLTHEELAALPLITPTRDSDEFAVYNQLFLAKGLTLNPHIEVQSMTETPPLVSVNMGLAFLPRAWVTDHMREVPLAETLPSRTLSLITSASHPLPPPMRAFKDCLLTKK